MNMCFMMMPLKIMGHHQKKCLGFRPGDPDINTDRTKAQKKNAEISKNITQTGTEK